MSLRDYFDAEMRLLQEEAVTFSEKYPDAARQLNLTSLRDRDPHIERLLEGVAFLTANIRAKLDDDIPEISAAFLQQAWPELLFPFPSATILEFSWRPQQLTKPLLIPKKTVSQSDSVGEEKTVCRFSTIADVMLYPLKLVELSVTEPGYGGTLFHFEFESECDDLNLESLIFYLHADAAVSLELFWALCGQVTQIHVNIKGKKIYVGDQSLLTPAYFSEEETLLPLSHNSFYGFYLLQDYFAFREKYFFIKLNGLSGYTDRRFSIEIHTQKTFPPEITIKRENFKLHCVPAINRYLKNSEPIQFTEKRFAYPLIMDLSRKESMILQGIESVKAIEHRSGVKKNIVSFSSFAHRDKNNYFYQLTLTEQDHYLKFSGHNLAPSDMSCLVHVSNGHYPRQYLAEGMINQLIDQPHYLAVKNIVRPSAFLNPAKKSNYRWNLISALSFQMSTLTHKDNLKHVLTLFDFTEREENNKKIDAIYDIKTTLFERFHRGALMKGITITVSIQENGFSSVADIYLFGTVLHQFFTLSMSLNMFVETIVFVYPSQREFLWKATRGYQPVM